MQTAIRITDDANDCRRGDARAVVGHPSTLRVAGRAPAEILVEDLSGSGFLFSSGDHVAVGAQVRVGLVGAGTATATIVRRDGDRHGAAFLDALTAAQLDQAFGPGTVVAARFAPEADLIVPFIGEARWPRPVRAAIWVTAATLPWIAILAALR